MSFFSHSFLAFLRVGEMLLAEIMLAQDFTKPWACAERLNWREEFVTTTPPAMAQKPFFVWSITTNLTDRANGSMLYTLQNSLPPALESLITSRRVWRSRGDKMLLTQQMIALVRVSLSGWEPRKKHCYNRCTIISHHDNTLDVTITTGYFVMVIHEKSILPITASSLPEILICQLQWLLLWRINYYWRLLRKIWNNDWNNYCWFTYFVAVTLAICLWYIRNFAWQQFPRNCCHTIL